MRARGTRTAVRRGFGAAWVLALVAVLAGCGTTADPIPASGVDTLVIPTPTPDPDDFVASIDNPWLPYQPGAEWAYVVGGGILDSRVTVSVEDRTRTVGGVKVTVVESLVESEAYFVDPLDVDYYAQDSDGNVWWFGREGEWEAGVGGAQAGLVMAANPRAGDGYRTAFSEGVVEDRATVVSVTDDLVMIEVQSDLEPDVMTVQSYAPDVGLVGSTRSTQDVASTWEMELVRGP